MRVYRLDEFGLFFAVEYAVQVRDDRQSNRSGKLVRSYIVLNRSKFFENISDIIFFMLSVGIHTAPLFDL